MTEVAPQLDYKKEEFIHPSYRYNKIMQQTGGQNVTITSGGNSETIFEIPVKAFNLAQSYIEFTLTPAASGATPNYNWLWTDCLTPFLTVQLYTRSGIYLCDLTNLTNYTKIAWKPETKLQEFLDFDYQGNDSVYTNSNGQMLCRNNTLPTSATKTLPLPFGLRHDNSNSNIPYTEPKYLEPGTGDTADPVFQVAFPLNMIKNTIFALDKNIYVGEILLMRFLWNNSNRIAYFGTSTTNPTTGAAAYGALNIVYIQQSL